ncbi:uncharacterized protein J8A68_000467 [[Candida] subhashii]|uniref:Elongator complex protein 5 n=1 Tax=[Candida] subhashii TaxID=561895 RepID=A0A8J5QWJ1_9ASCO|nr:uncharacterized protein J8A68_000467 [[Candida] subhashii]KAG7666037.1 hypothetical protein J8A68_000467 [[Candida] subhashii]
MKLTWNQWMKSSAFQLILDSLSQSSHHLIQEFIHRSTSTTSTNTIYLSYETINKPTYATHFLDCTTTTSTNDIIKFVQTNSESSKTVVIIDSLNYIPQEDITQFVARLASPAITILSVFHTNCPIADSTSSKLINYPSCLSLLSYIASSVYEVEPLLENDGISEEEILNKIQRLDFPVNSQLNNAVFKLTLTNRRKSGRALIYKFKMNCINHEYEILKEKNEVDEDIGEDESLLKDLTTFNLTTSNKQKLAREQVELPYMQAQEALGATGGGAIVYEFEKDDDYDEEDPYEDPF